jgi:anti-anti-sigma factor
LIKKGYNQITIDLESAEVIDSSGIGILVATYNELQNMNGNLAVINANENIMKMLRIMRLDTHFSISGK